MLLEHDRGKQRRLAAMRRLQPRHRPKAAQRLAARFGVVGQRVQPALHLRRRVEPRDQRALGRGERQPRRFDRAVALNRGWSARAFFRPATSSSAVQALLSTIERTRPAGSTIAVRRLWVMVPSCLANHVDAELRRQPIDRGFLGGREPPHRGIGAELLGVRAQGLRAIELRIEADRHQPHLPRQRRIGGDQLLHLGEPPIDQRAELREWTARVDERDRGRGALEIGAARSAGRPDRSACVSGHRIARLQQVHVRRRRNGGARIVGERRRSGPGDRRQKALSGATFSVAVIRSPATRSLRIAGSFTVYGMVIAGMKPGMSSCLTSTSLVSALTTRICPVSW